MRQSGTGDAMSYTTDAEETPDIIVGIQKPDADFELDLKATKVSKGTDINVLFDQKEDTFAFETTSDAPAEFELSITRIDAADVPAPLRKPGGTFYKFFTPDHKLLVVASQLKPRIIVGSHLSVLLDKSRLTTRVPQAGHFAVSA